MSGLYHYTEYARVYDGRPRTGKQFIYDRPVQTRLYLKERYGIKEDLNFPYDYFTVQSAPF